MNLLTHDWNGNPITQLAKETAIAKFTIPASYVNATQMCQACGKAWADYAKTASTKAYWEALSADMNKCISEIVISIKGGSDKQVQGTWVHPEIAIDLAQWASVEFRIWANRTLKQLISGEADAQPTPTPALPPSPEKIASVINLVLSGTDTHPSLKAGVIANAIVKHHPRHAITIEAAKSVLATPIDAELVRPTALGKKLAEVTGDKWSAIRVNEMLTKQGFQIKNPDGDNPAYLPTEKGKEHGQIVFDTARGRDKTVQSLMWHFSVLEVLDINDG